MTKIDVNEILTSLFNYKRVFLSEADFQHCLALELENYICKNHLPYEVYLEYPEKKEDKEIYVDIAMLSNQDSQDNIYIELKYKTRKAQVNISNGQSKELKNQMAHDVGRFMFLNDICRLEYFKQTNHINIGFAIMLTNDKLYTEESKGKVCKDCNLVGILTKGEKKLNSDKGWAEKYSKLNLILTKDYTLCWDSVRIGELDFSYLLVEV